MEEFLQKAQIERERTAVEVNALVLKKDKLLASAKAEADLLRANANAEANRIIQEAKINGTALLFSAAGISSQEEMMAFTYIRTLKNRKNLDLDISYLSSDNVLRTSTVFSAT
jgi:regulator of protease activity HflC (stomatin/prohibitin superfamily)